MLYKIGESNPITIIKPIDVDPESTQKSLKKAVKSVKDKLNSFPNETKQVEKNK